MKKGLILILCLIFNFIGCTSTANSSNPSSSTESKPKEVNDSIQSTDTNKSNKEKTDDNKNTSDSDKSKETSSSNAQTKNSTTANSDINNSNKNIVNSKVKLFAGAYFDDKCFGENTLKNYCEIMISTIKDTSFDFTVYEVNIGDDNKESKKVIFNTNTAYFINDGTKAVFNGKDYTLNFSLPNNHNAYPIVTDIEVSGFNRLENNTYVNNGIPGHEFG